MRSDLELNPQSSWELDFMMLRLHPGLIPFWQIIGTVILVTCSWQAIFSGILHAAGARGSHAFETLKFIVAAALVFALWMIFMVISSKRIARQFNPADISRPLLEDRDLLDGAKDLSWMSSCFALVAIIINLGVITAQLVFLDESHDNFAYEKGSAIMRGLLTSTIIICSPSLKLKQGVILATSMNQLLVVSDMIVLQSNWIIYFIITLGHSTCLIYTRLEQLIPLQKEIGYDNSTIFTMYTFWWVYPTLLKAKLAGKLESKDFPPLSFRDYPDVLNRKFQSLYSENNIRHMISRPLNLLITTCYSIQKSVFISSYINGIVFLSCMFTDPILLSALLSQPMSKLSWVLLIGLTITMLIRVSCMEVCFFLSTRVSNNVRTVLCDVLFSASVRSRRAIDPAILANLMATDAEKLGQWSWGIFFLAQWSWAVISLPFVIFFLRKIVGNGAFIGVGCLMSTGFVSWIFGKYLSVLELRLQNCRDERARCLRSFLLSVKIMKLENLQSIWINRLESSRREELKQLAKIRYVLATSDFMGSCLSLLVPVSMFTWRICIDHLPLTAEVAFVSLAWIAQMQWSISTLPAIYQAWSSLQPSFDRLASALESSSSVSDEPALDAIPTIPEQVMHGLTIIVGPTGSGKSTLLASLASKNVGAYVRQHPFLVNGTIQDNITFGLDANEDKLRDVIQRTNLEQDIAALPNGLQAQIGPNGVQLSGGQKARVCLARALYSDFKLLFLDGVFAAVDRTTGSHIWKNVICHLKHLKKTIILVTHEIRFLSSPVVDNVVLICEKQIITWGPFSSFNQEILEKYSKHLSENEFTEQMRFLDSQQSPVGSYLTKCSEEPSLKETYRFLENLLILLKGKVIDDSLIYDQILVHLKPDFTHAEESSQTRGSISLSDLFVYFREFGWFFVPVIVLALCEAVASLMSNVWLAVWSGATSFSDNRAQKSFLLIYFSIGMFHLILVFFQTLVRAKCSLIVSSEIHRKMIHRLVEAPLSFFDNHSSGMILNRFLQDLSNIDSSVPGSLFGQISKTLNLLVQFALIASYAPFVYLTLPFMAVAYISIFQMIRNAARDTRRIESESKTPVYELFHDVLEGREVIQCSSAESRFEAINRKKVQSMAAAKVGNEAVMKWAQSLTTQSSCMVYLVTGCLSLMLIDQGKMSMGQLGLVLYYAAVLQRGVMDCMMGLTNVETNFVSVERIGQFLRIPTEENTLVEVVLNRDHRKWPTEGNLNLKDVALRYVFNRSEALKGLTISFPAGIKVAIIGRTGCGKSSLVSALSSLYPISRGTITLDNVSLHSVPLSVARSVVRVIPQDPILFTGTIRANITINKSISDNTIWSILEKINLAALIRRLGGLDAQILNDGANLSAGEKQLLCMARAFVMGLPKILVCDEPTSNVDRYTGTVLTDLLLSLNITVLVVMHRLETIGKFDRVLLLEDGKIVIYGDTQQLLHGPEGSALREFIDHEHV